MNHQFLIRPAQLNQAFESSNSSGGKTQGSNVTRRVFIKRTGGATVAATIAWNIQIANATGDGSDSSSFSVLGTVTVS